MLEVPSFLIQNSKFDVGSSKVSGRKFEVRCWNFPWSPVENSKFEVLDQDNHICNSKIIASLSNYRAIFKFARSEDLRKKLRSLSWDL